MILSTSKGVLAIYAEALMSVTRCLVAWRHEAVEIPKKPLVDHPKDNQREVPVALPGWEPQLADGNTNMPQLCCEHHCKNKILLSRYSLMPL